MKRLTVERVKELEQLTGVKLTHSVYFTLHMDETCAAGFVVLDETEDINKAYDLIEKALFDFDSPEVMPVRLGMLTSYNPEYVWGLECGFEKFHVPSSMQNSEAYKLGREDGAALREYITQGGSYEKVNT